MKTTVSIDGEDFLINGRKTYAGVSHQGRRIEGLLMNSRMVQAVFDDDNPATRGNWVYPDTGAWDPQRNVDEFCKALPIYRQHGLLGVTVGLQGGGPIYTKEIYDNYLDTAFRPDGSIKNAYLDRLRQILQAADDCGMVVIVNYFYWRQHRFQDDPAICRATEGISQWLMGTGFRNIIVDVQNELTEGPGLLCSLGIARLIEIVRQTTLQGRRLLVGASTTPWRPPVSGGWQKLVDLFMPHGNDSRPDVWRRELREWRESEYIKGHLRPICCNEDSIDLPSMEVCLDEHISWGYYDQGYGCDQTQVKHDWKAHPREKSYELLSGYQTVPVNWGINTPHKQAFFGRVKEVTQGR